MKDKITIKIMTDAGIEDREIFMSFGLLNHLSSIIGGPEQVPALEFDPELSMQVISSVLIPRKSNGSSIKKIETADDIDIPGISQETAEELFDWIKGHLIDFFSRRAAATMKLMDTDAMKKFKEIQVQTNS